MSIFVILVQLEFKLQIERTNIIINIIMEFKLPKGMELIQSHLPKKGKIALDFGANNGKWTRALSFYFEKVIAIEPDDRAFKINKSKLPINCDIIKAALSTQEGRIEYTIAKHSMNSKIGNRGEHVTTVETITLNKFIELPIDFIKLDIEGHEEIVLSDSSIDDFITKLKPTLVVEPHNNESAIIDKMSRFNFYEVDVYKKKGAAKGQIVFFN